MNDFERDGAFCAQGRLRPVSLLSIYDTASNRVGQEMGSIKSLKWLYSQITMQDLKRK